MSNPQLPLCFVLMPFGEKTDASGVKINFDDIYEKLIRPAIRLTGLEPIRADEEKAGGMIQKAMFERLILCEYAIADLSTANANVFYELGVRHAVRPYKTILIFNSKMEIPFDLKNLRALPYQLDENGCLADKQGDFENLKKELDQIKADTYVDSPLFQLFKDELKTQELDSRKTEIFREQVLYSQRVKKKLNDARKKGKEEVAALEEELGEISDIESGILIDLLLSYRATKAWDEMIRLVENIPEPLAERVMIQEQLAFALNRNGQVDRAKEVLLQVLEKNGPSSETYGILGRIYKDQWQQAHEEGSSFLSGRYLEEAIETYVKGFEADWRDHYPGVNAVTMMEMKDPPDERQTKLLPVVTYAVEQKIKRGNPDYWDYATLLELAVLSNNKEEVGKWLGKALTKIREIWEPETTARNLGLIREARERRKEDAAWIKEVENELLKKA
jgi:tetratricopeptide (TPR) repeat protein